MNHIAPILDADGRVSGPGLYALPPAAYHLDPAPENSLSHSIARLLLDKSPRHAAFAHPRIGPAHEPSEPSDAQMRGSILHAMILGEGSAFKVLDFKDFRTDRAKEARDAVKADGAIPLLIHKAREYQEIAAAILDQIQEHPACEDFADGRSEVTGVWKEADMFWCRMLIDRLPYKPGAPIFDLKSTGRDASPEKFARTIERDYAMAVPFYLRGCAALLPQRPADYRFVAFETDAPFAVSVHALAPELVEMAEADMARALKLWARCTILGEWPGYSTELHTVHPSAHRLTQAMMGEAA